MVFEEERLTYRELAARARALARHLVRLGVGPEVVVGVAAERSVELVAGLLGVLGAGGAYLPLEPDLPRQRLAMILEDAARPSSSPAASCADALPLDAVPGLRLAWLDGLFEGPAGRRGAPSPAGGGRQRRLRHLHLGLDRPAEGGGQQPPRHRQPAAVDAGGLRPGRGRPVPAEDPVRLRRLGPGILRSPDPRSAAGGGPAGRAPRQRLPGPAGRAGGDHDDPLRALDAPLLPGGGGRLAARCRSLRRVLVSGEALPWEVEQRCLADAAGAALSTCMVRPRPRSR